MRIKIGQIKTCVIQLTKCLEETYGIICICFLKKENLKTNYLIFHLKKLNEKQVKLGEEYGRNKDMSISVK